MLVASGIRVKVLSPRVAGIKTIEGVWQIYQLHIHLTPKLIVEIDDEDVIDVDCHEFDDFHTVLSLKFDCGVRLVSLSRGRVYNQLKIDAKDYALTFDGLFVVSENKSVLSLRHNSSCMLVCGGKGVELSIYDRYMHKIHEKVSDVISFKNGTCFLNFDGEWKFYSKNGNYFGSLFDVEIDRHGVILGRYFKAQKRLSKVGSFDDEYVMIVQDGQTVVTNGDRIVSILGEQFDSITILK